jgi:hypothetical protein
MTKRSTFLLVFIFAFLVVFAIHFLNFPGSVPRFKQLTGGGILLDQTPSFNVDAVYQRLTDYGEEGRKSYRFRNLTTDIILPLSLLPFLLLLMSYALRSIQLKGFARILLFGLTFAYVVFDLAENAAVLVLLNNFPRRLNLLAEILPYLTSIKRVASLFALIVPLAILGIQFIRARPK